MADFLRRNSLFITATVLLIASFQLMSMSVANRQLPQVGSRMVADLLAPAEKGYHEIFESVRYIWSRYLYLVNIESERNDLVNRLKELEAHNSRLMEYESENKRLKSLLKFSERTGRNGVVAFVIGRDPSNWVKSITIDRGSLDGLRPGLAVVDGNAIVGQTISVGRTSSRVLLLTDNASAIDAIVQSSRAVGTAEGGGGRTDLRLRYVLKLKEFAVNPGDRVIASGLDGVYPKGGLIGVVNGVNPNSGGLFQDIQVEPSVDVFRLENVLVLIPELERQPLPDTEAQLSAAGPGYAAPAVGAPAASHDVASVLAAEAEKAQQLELQRLQQQRDGARRAVATSVSGQAPPAATGGE